MRKNLLGLIVLVAVILGLSGGYFYYAAYLEPILILQGTLIVRAGAGTPPLYFTYPTNRGHITLTFNVTSDGCYNPPHYPYSTLEVQISELNLGPSHTTIADVKENNRTFTRTFSYNSNPPYSDSEGEIIGIAQFFNQGSDFCSGFPVTINYTLTAYP